MKWTVKDSIPNRPARIPDHSIYQRNTNLLLSALVRYSMIKRKYKSGDAISNKLITCSKSHFVRKSETNETNQSFSNVTRQELTAIQIQLAVLSDADGDRPIHIAVANENFKLVQKLCRLMVKNSISLDITNCLRQTPLHLAVMTGNLEILQLLLENGASPLVCDRNGNSVLHMAVKSNSDKGVLDILLSNSQVKSILNLMDYEGYSALHYAVFKKNSNAIKLLKNSGADIDKIDGKSGRTALIHAVLEQNTYLVDVLLDCGACPAKVDYSGQSAFEMALQIANVSVITQLEKRMPYNETAKLKESTRRESPAKATKRT